MIEISPPKIALTQLLHCHTELSQAVDLIQRKAFMHHWAKEETDQRKNTEDADTSIRMSRAVTYIQEEAGCTICDFSRSLALPCAVQMYGTA